MRRLLLLVALLASVPSSVGAQRDQRTRALVEQFEQAVALYRQWEVGRARIRLAQLSVQEQRSAVAALLNRERVNARARGASVRANAESLRLVRAAAALEMEAAAEEVRTATSLVGSDIIKMRISMAVDLFGYVEEHTGVKDQAAERWATAIGIESLSRGQFELAPDILSVVCSQDRATAALLLTCGIAHESFSMLSYDTGAAIRRVRGPSDTRARARKERAASLDRAKRFFEQSMALAEADGEAALRLAYVRLRKGDLRDATSILETLTARTDLPARVTYLGKLFLGRAYDEEGRLAEAEHTYKEAGAVGEAQSVLLALAHNAQLQGRAGDAARLAERAATVKMVPDPWWRYPFGQYWMASGLFTALRREALE